MDDKIITLETASTREAFKFFLRRELSRHVDDILKIQKDLKNLEDVPYIDVPLNTWIEVKRKEELNDSNRKEDRV